MKIIKILFLLSVSSCLFSELLESDLIYVPYYANLTESLEISNNTIKAGTRFIVIRIEEEKVLGNFSRKGIHELTLSQTNIQDLVSEQKQLGESSSRIAFFIGNKLVSGESNWKHLIHADEVKQYDEWVILYAPSSGIGIEQSLTDFNESYERAKIKSPQTIFVYIDTEGNKKILDQLGYDLGLSLATLPWYLSKGYVKGLGHLNEGDELPAIAVVKSTNNIKSIYLGADSVQQYLSVSGN